MQFYTQSNLILIYEFVLFLVCRRVVVFFFSLVVEEKRKCRNARETHIRNVYSIGLIADQMKSSVEHNTQSGNLAIEC